MSITTPRSDLPNLAVDFLVWGKLEKKREGRRRKRKERREGGGRGREEGGRLWLSRGVQVAAMLLWHAPEGLFCAVWRVIKME